MARIKPLQVPDAFTAVPPSLQVTPETPVLPVEAVPHQPDKQLNLIEREPVRVANGLTALVAALSVLVKPWFNITDEQQLALVTVIAIIGPLVASIYARSKVVPTAKLQ
jgi:hypothetical protein